MKHVVWLAILASCFGVAQTRTDMFNQKPNIKATKTFEKAKKMIEKGKLKTAEEKLLTLVDEPGFDFQAVDH